MKIGLLVLIILSLILPVGAYCLSEGDRHSQNTEIDSDGRSLALNNSKSNNSATRWYKRQNDTALNGVALVIHGLNGRPEKMESIIAKLTVAGIDCINLSLRGHGENFSKLENTDTAEARMQTFKSVSYPLWRSEIFQAYQQVKIQSDRYRTCVYLVGFSMGGLLGVDLFTSNPFVKFDKMILYAPALKMHNRNFLLKTISPFPGLVVPSFAPDAYLANEGTPMAAYNALFDAVGHLEKNLDPKINVPTIIFIDKQDELISFSGLNTMIMEQELDRWKLHPVKKDPTATEREMHHLIIDEASVGKQTWKEIEDTTIKHLKNGSKLCVPAR